MTASEKNIRLYPQVPTIKVDISRQDRTDGSILLQSEVPLEAHPYRLTERLKHWAALAPNRVFIGRKNGTGEWITLNYAETFARVQHIAQALINRKLSASSPLVILSENGIEHGLLALAAHHAAIPYSPIAPAYSLRSTDFQKLKHIISILDPGLIFADDLKKYEPAIRAIKSGTEIIYSDKPVEGLTATPFEELLKTEITDEVEFRYQAIKSDTIAKILFTSGSTGFPKGVINTHGNISTNWQQITQTFPFLKDEGLEFIDWLPWNHTFGGNHNFGLTVFNGGSLYIDDGNPTPEGIPVTIKNLRERNPTVYFNVPKGFEALIPYFKKDRTLGNQFFSKLKMLFYAGAGMPQHVWDSWEELSIQYTGRKVLMGTGLGCTESCPSALFASEPGGFAGLLGVPVPGLQLKLVPIGERLEARYLGNNIFPGYWKQPDLSRQVFDEEGFYCTGDALRFVDPDDANKGMVFDGRFAEDFKLNTGTWVRAGLLRSQLISAGNGLIQDVVITGHDNDFIGAIVFIAADTDNNISLKNILNQLAVESTGSASLIKRALVADISLSIDRGEITDKGTINPRMVLQNHPELLNMLYSKIPGAEIVEVNLNVKEELN